MTGIAMLWMAIVIGQQAGLPSGRDPESMVLPRLRDASSCDWIDREPEGVVNWEGRPVGDRECQRLADRSDANGDRVVELRLICTQVTDGCLRSVARFEHLEALDLRGTEITDAGLDDLKAPSRLVLLDLRGTRVTACGVRRLQRRLPAVEILWLPPPGIPLQLATRSE
ncbi:hypothetical protein [Caulifigura coniformis]|uniref:hypothetical protein n=1 Tax=Caulifigura coniformis TaxID=2527983 RepID=UPI00119DBB14|nr:hypothetical protein [Caulifigura coniformis]